MELFAASRVAMFGTILVLSAALPAMGQIKAKVVLGEVTDDRISRGLVTGALVLGLNLEGDGLDEVKAARILPKEAKDDTGKRLLDPKAPKPDFASLSGGRLEIRLENPPRSAKTVSLSGTAELYVPSRDPDTLVKVPDFLAKPGKPLAAKGLKAAKVEIEVVSKERYIEERKKMRLDDKMIAALRAEGKERGMNDEEIEGLVEISKAIDEMAESDIPANALFLQMPKASKDKIEDLMLETAGGETIETGGSSGRSNGKVFMKQVELREPLPQDAVLVVSLYTDKAIVSIPFELKEIPLP